jgi:hypothetical protein
MTSKNICYTSLHSTEVPTNTRMLYIEQPKLENYFINLDNRDLPEDKESILD